MPQETTPLQDLFNEYNSKHKFASNIKEFEDVMKDESNRKDFFTEYNSKLKLAKDFTEFETALGVKKKAESSSSSGGLAGPYASGQKPSKPKGFGDIVSEKIAEVTPAEQKQAVENDAIKASVADFGRKLEKVAKNNPQMAVAGGMEQLAQKKKVEELDTYGGTVKRIAAENFSKLLKAPAGGLQIVKSTFGDDKTVNGVEKFLQEIADVGSKVSDEIKKEDELISNNKETSITKLLGDGKFAEAGSRLGKGVVGSLAALPMYMNPATIGAMVTSAAADAGHQAKLEGRAVKDSDVAAEVAIAGLEVITEELFGTGSVVSKAFSKLNKSGADAALDSFRKSFQKDLAKTYGWELGGELSNTLGAYVINKARGKEQSPLLQQLSDTALQTAAMTSGFHTLGNVAGQEKETFSPQEPLTPQQQVEQAGVLDPNTGRLVPKDPNDPELPTNTGGSGDLMTPEAMQQAGVEPQAQDPVIVAIQQNAENITDNQGNKVQVTDVVPNGVVIDNTVIPFNEVFIEGVSLEEIGSVPAEQVQQPSATEGVIQEIIDSNTPVTDTEGNPVNLEEALAANVDPNTLILTEENRTVEDVITEAEGIDQQEQQVPQKQPVETVTEQVDPTPVELPKKIFHATNAQFEGQPTVQSESKVSAFGTEPAGVFYSTNPDQAKQAIGNGENARIVEADFNPKNPLVINDVNDEVYSNTLNESKQQAIAELSPDYIEAGVDLNTLEEGEIPEAVNKRTTEIFAEKLKEQGFDSVVNNENGDIIVLDPSAVSQTIKTPKQETEVEKQIKDLKYQLNSLDAQDDSKLTDKEKKRIKGEDRNTVTSQARGYFLDGGKVLWESLKKETGFKGGEFKDFLGIVSNPGRTVDDIANYLWENRDNDKFDTSDYRNAIIDVLNENRAEWLVNQRNEVDTNRSQEIEETKQRIQEQIDILENADLSFEEIKNEIEVNEAMWEQKIATEGRTKQKSSTFVESDIPIVLEYINKAKELKEGVDKSKIQDKIDEIISKDEKLKKVIENLDNILKQLNYTVDC